MASATSRHLQPSLLSSTADSALDETIGVGLRGVDLGVLASVLETLVPAEIDLEVVLVWQGVLDSLELWHSSQNQLAHLVHGSLHRGTVILSKDLEGGIPGRLPSIGELVSICLDFRHTAEAAPLPVGIDIGAEDTVPCLLEGGVLVAEEAPELGASALEHGQPVNGGVDVDALPLDDVDLHVAGLGAVLDERVRVWLAVDVHAHPAVGDDVDVRGVDVAVLLDEVGAEDGAEELWRVDGGLLGRDVNGVLD